MTMSIEDSPHVRITNAQIFEELRLTRTDVASVKQSVEETVKPQLGELRSDVKSLQTNKADKAETAEMRGSINSVRIQAYAIGGGVLSGLVILNALGFFQVAQ